MKKEKTISVLFLVQSAMIAAIYVVLTIVFAPISFGQIQFRIAEALTILPAFTPAAIPGLFVGCLIGNILGGAILPDIIVGSMATLLGAIFTYLLRNRSKWLAPLPPIIANNGFYDGTTFHRIVKDFMIQTGSKDGDGKTGAKLSNLKDGGENKDYSIKGEFLANGVTNTIKFEEGTVAMARADYTQYSSNLKEK